MCGIVGLFSKSSGIADRLGAYVADMLIEMGSRGPDSAGIAIYGDGEVSATTKLSLYSAQVTRTGARFARGSRRPSA